MHVYLIISGDDDIISELRGYHNRAHGGCTPQVLVAEVFYFRPI